MSNSGVDEDKAGDFESLAKYQENSRENYIITVYGEGKRGKDVLFDGKACRPSLNNDDDERRYIDLWLEDNHYYVITSVKSMFNCNHYYVITSVKSMFNCNHTGIGVVFNT